MSMSSYPVITTSTTEVAMVCIKENAEKGDPFT